MKLSDLHAAVDGNAAGFRSRVRLQPAGGEGDKVFPPTYSDATYAKEKRRVPGHAEPVECVLLDSVQSQANRIEEALQDAIDEGRIQIPVVEVDFSDVPIVDPGDQAEGLYEPIGRVTSLEAPHRIADAILRDSELDGVPFRNTPLGKKIGMANLRNATPLFEICPTALLLGIWDSTGPKGGLGTKFQRAMVSEIIGVNASYGTKTSSRIDPLGIRKDAAQIYESTTSDWTLDAKNAKQKGGKPILKGKDGKPSEANHGNIVPSMSSISRDGVPLAGGVTIDYAEQMTVLSLPAIRRLRFPIDDKVSREANIAGRTVIAALGLCGAVLAAERGLDLRSRCLLWPTAPLTWDLLHAPGQLPQSFELTADAAIRLLKEAVDAAISAKLPWMKKPLILKPAAKLVELVRKSQLLAVQGGGEE
jgi:CRISPR-associated protein Csb1